MKNRIFVDGNFERTIIYNFKPTVTKSGCEKCNYRPFAPG